MQYYTHSLFFFPRNTNIHVRNDDYDDDDEANTEAGLSPARNLYSHAPRSLARSLILPFCRSKNRCICTRESATSFPAYNEWITRRRSIDVYDLIRKNSLLLRKLDRRFFFFFYLDILSRVK